MSDQINQIQASFDSVEDRILLKFKTNNEAIYLAWISRRYCKLLLPVLHGRHPSTGEKILHTPTSLEREFEQQKAQLEGDYSSPYHKPENPSYPLGEEPILLTQISFKNLNSDSPSISLEPNNGPGLLLPFHPQLLGPMLKILTTAIEKTDWNLGDEILYQLPSSETAVH